MKRKTLRRLARLMPVRWLFIDYSLFRGDYMLVRIRGRCSAWCKAKKWVSDHPHGSVTVSPKRPRWEKNGELVPITK